MSSSGVNHGGVHRQAQRLQGSDRIPVHCSCKTNGFSSSSSSSSTCDCIGNGSSCCCNINCRLCCVGSGDASCEQGAHPLEWRRRSAATADTEGGDIAEGSAAWTRSCDIGCDRRSSRRKGLRVAALCISSHSSFGQLQGSVEIPVR